MDEGNTTPSRKKQRKRTGFGTDSGPNRKRAKKTVKEPGEIGKGGEEEENETGRFVCDECKKVLFSTKAVRVHKHDYHKKLIKTNDGRLIRYCDICKRKMHSVVAKENILDTSQPVICAACKTILYQSENMETEDENSKGQSFECSDCGRWFNNSRAIHTHVRLHENEKYTEFKCDCSETFSDLSEFLDHRNHHCNIDMKKVKILNLNCKYCTKTFSKIVKFINHMKKRHQEQCRSDKIKLVCNRPDCGAIFLDPDSFKNHQYIHDYRFYKCCDCNAMFSHLRSFKRHCKIYNHSFQ